jgi:hypothetical protein
MLKYEGYAKYQLALKGEREGRRPPAAVEDSEQARSHREKTHTLWKYVSPSLSPTS